MNLPSPTERKYFYDQYWHRRNEEREEFERRVEYALKEFGKYAPLTDERIPIYMKYGKPTRHYIITPEKKVGVVSKEYVRPAEIWTYKSEGIEFDFIRLARVFMIIAKSEFGEKVIMPYLKEDTIMQSVSDIIPAGKLNFDITYSRFRQQKNLSKTGYEGKNEFYVDLLDYQDDAKKISDLVFAKLIDDAWIEEKFFKPVGRVIPLVSAKMLAANPFYIYHEVYNLKTQDGQHLLKVDYEIYNKERMRKEIVDIMSQTESGEGDIAYIAAKYHPMDLPSRRVYNRCTEHRPFEWRAIYSDK
ncbi:MAG: GWxTD domain-containing protein [bacterium]